MPFGPHKNFAQPLHPAFEFSGLLIGKGGSNIAFEFKFNRSVGLILSPPKKLLSVLLNGSERVKLLKSRLEALGKFPVFIEDGDSSIRLHRNINIAGCHNSQIAVEWSDIPPPGKRPPSRNSNKLVPFRSGDNRGSDDIANSSGMNVPLVRENRSSKRQGRRDNSGQVHEASMLSDRTTGKRKK